MRYASSGVRAPLPSSAATAAGSGSGARPGGGEHQGHHPVRLPDGHPLGDEAAERRPQHRGPIDEQGIEHCRAIAGELRGAVRAGGELRCADAALVVHGDREAPGQQRHQRREDDAGGAQAGDEQQRRTVAFDGDRQPSAIARGDEALGHAGGDATRSPAGLLTPPARLG
jgi:hypothetical protein